MTSKRENAHCRVCGLDYFPYFPWSESGDVPTHDICECCGVEFGYEDTILDACLKFRRHWVIVQNCTWSEPKQKSADWDMPAQLRNVPSAFAGPDDESLIAAHLAWLHSSNS